MARPAKKARIGILGCGAIGSGIAKSTLSELKDLCCLSGIYDCTREAAKKLERSLQQNGLIKNSYEALIDSCDLIVEAVSAEKTLDLIKQALSSKKDVLAMSVGKLLNAEEIFSLAEKNNCFLLLPSGAIAGIDAIKAASLRNITNLTLTTRKPTSGFKNNPYIKNKGIDLSNISKETIIFEGNVNEAVQHFPRNINVAATLALASNNKNKLIIKIITSPEYTKNSHEIVAEGDFGTLTTRTDNLICPENPKTSYLAVLSGIQALRGFCSAVKIGT